MPGAADVTIPLSQLAQSRVLIVDDDESNCLIVADFLSSLCQVHYVTTAEEIFAECESYQPDLIILDIFIGDESGLDICKSLKQSIEHKHLPVIFVTSSARHEELDQCWGAGCVDFIAKPVNFTTLINRVKVHLTLKYQQELLREQSYKDGLTGLYNRSYLSHIFPIQYAQCQRETLPLSLLLLDIDWFKRFNDEYGHVEGDACIKQVSEVIDSLARRPLDMVFRYGGEEFLCLLPNTQSEGAQLIANKIVGAVAALNIPHKHSDYERVTVSVGLYTHESEAALPLTKLVESADKALYEAKQKGRNQLCISQSVTGDSPPG